MKVKSIIIIIAAVIIGTVFLSLAGSLVEKNNDGNFQIKQAWISGTMSTRFNAGTYGQLLGTIYTYKNVATVGFGDQKGEGSADIAAIPVIFNDGSKASISGLVRVRLPLNSKEALALKKEFAGGFEHFIRAGIVPIVQNAVKLSANLRSAQDAYTTIALFQQAVEDQLKNGIYVTKSDVIKVVRSTGDIERMKVTVVVKDKDGIPIRQGNRLTELGCEITSCMIDIPTFDAKVEESIASRKDEAMKTELAKQKALRAKQDTITAEEEGKASIAVAKAAEEVLKITAVTKAEKELDVERLAAKKALATADKIKAEGMAKAAANRALVAAGLTPEQ